MHQLARSVLVEEPLLSRAATHTSMHLDGRICGCEVAALDAETGVWRERANDKRGEDNHTVR